MKFKLQLNYMLLAGLMVMPIMASAESTDDDINYQYTSNGDTQSHQQVASNIRITNLPVFNGSYNASLETAAMAKPIEQRVKEHSGYLAKESGGDTNRRYKFATPGSLADSDGFIYEFTVTSVPSSVGTVGVYMVREDGAVDDWKCNTNANSGNCHNGTSGSDKVLSIMVGKKDTIYTSAYTITEGGGYNNGEQSLVRKIRVGADDDGDGVIDAGELLNEYTFF